MLDLEKFAKLPLLGILRGLRQSDLAGIVEICRLCGLETIEVALNTPGAAEQIRELAERGRKAGLAVGAGTVLDALQLKQALDAGASFIVTPVLVEDVARRCRQANVPFFPGAFTPQEVYQAWSAGAALVKLFPAALGQPAYLRELKGPFDKVKLLACGGVTPENLPAWFAAGASAVAFGGSVFDPKLLAEGRAAEVRARLAALVGAWRGREKPAS